MVRVLPALVCTETETGQVFDACHIDRNSGVDVMCWTGLLDRDKGLYMGCAWSEELDETEQTASQLQAELRVE